MLTQTDPKLGLGLFINEIDLKEVENALCNQH
jgi:hypothetical protein